MCFECFPATAVQLLEEKMETNQFFIFRQHFGQHKLNNYQAQGIVCDTEVVVPTFDTKVTEYLCSGWVFIFFRQISTF